MSSIFPSLLFFHVRRDEFHPPESVSLFLLSPCVSADGGSRGGIDWQKQITKLSNRSIDWLSLFSLSPFSLPPLPHPFILPLPLSIILSPRLCLFLSYQKNKQVGRRVRRRSLTAAGRPASVCRCHGDATESGTVRTERTRSSALQVSFCKPKKKNKKQTNSNLFSARVN